MNKRFLIIAAMLFVFALSALTAYAQEATLDQVDFIQNGEKVMALTGGDVTVNVKISSPSGGEEIIASAAIYNETGLSKLDTAEKTLTAGLNVLEPLLIEGVTEEDTVKVYVWYADSLTPLCEPVLLTKNRSSAAMFYLNKFNSLMNRENLMATAELYDTKSGGFYFTGSSRDYEPFEAHLESTAQMVDYMYIAGVLDEMPADIKNKLVNFFQTRQSSADGFFYDMRDGEFITDVRPSKKGRDYDKSKAALERLGSAPLYSRGGTAASAALFSAPAAINDDTKYDSLENFEAYVNNLFDSHPDNMYYVGNELVSTYSQYKDLAGYADIARSVAENRQNAATGLWGAGKDYDALNAAMKLSGIFDKTYPFPNFEKALFSVIDIAKADVAPTASSIWNILDFINTAKNTYTDSATAGIANDAIDKNLGDLTAIILKRVSELKQADGLYGYLEDGTGTTTQGWINSLGLEEGSINANLLCTAYMYEQAYWLYGLRTEKPLASYADEYFEALKNARHTVKKYYTADAYNMSFEGEENGLTLNGAALAADPADGGNSCLSLAGGSYLNPSVIFHEMPVLDRAVVGQRIYLKSNDDNNYGTFEFIWGEGDSATGMHLKIKRADGQSSKLYLTPNYASGSDDIELCTLSLNQWHDVKAVYSPYESTNLRVYVDNRIVYFGSYSYINNGEDSAGAEKVFRQFVVHKHSGESTDLLIDDIFFRSSNAPKVYDLHFEDENETQAQGVIAYKSTSTVIEDTMLSGNKYVEINNPSGSEQYGLGFAPVSDYSKIILNQRVLIKRGATSAGTYYMYLGENDSSAALQLRFDVWYENQTVNDSKILVVNNNGEEEVSTHIPVNKWCDLSIEYAPNAVNGKVKVYVNGVLGYEGNRCYDPVAALRQNVFKKDGSSDGYLLLDDMEMIVIQ